MLVDGRTVGSCGIAATKAGATAHVELLTEVSKRNRTAIEREALRLLRFAHPNAASYDVTFG